MANVFQMFISVCVVLTVLVLLSLWRVFEYFRETAWLASIYKGKQKRNFDYVVAMAT